MSLSADMLMQLISSLGTFGFVLWLVHRTTTHTIPRLAQENHDRQALQRADFLDSQSRIREDFKAALAEQREAFQREMEREREIHGQHVGTIIEAIRDTRGTVQ